MSLEAIKQEMQDLLSAEKARVLCISGKWGVGKTHSWNEIIKKTKKDKDLDLHRTKYAYVSLFGIKDVDDIYQTIFINTEQLRNKPEEDSFKKWLINKIYSLRIMSFIKEAANHENAIPWVSSFGSLVRTGMSLLVRNMIICIDDIERKGKNISIVEIMGIADQLRETRNCTVVILLNEDNLNEDDRNHFLQYSEKTIDIKMIFTQEPIKAADIAFNEEDTILKILHKASVELGITNIRVLEKAKYYAQKLQLLTIDIKNKDLIEKIFRSLLLFCWSVLSHGNKEAPTIEYMKNYLKNMISGKRNEDSDDNTLQWSATLSAYKFLSVNEFDEFIIESIKSGYFETEKAADLIKKILSDDKKNLAQIALSSAWTKAFSSFKNNDKEIAEKIYNTWEEYISYVSVDQLQNASLLLKEIKYPEKSKTLIKKFVESNKDEDVFNLGSGLYPIQITDHDIIEAFDLEQSKRPQKPKGPRIIDSANRILNDRTWSTEDEECLRRLSVDDFEQLILSEPHQDAITIIRAAFTWFSMQNPSPEQVQISKNAKEALIRVAKLSPINQARVRALGVMIDNEDSDRSGADK